MSEFVYCPHCNGTGEYLEGQFCHNCMGTGEVETVENVENEED